MERCKYFDMPNAWRLWKRTKPWNVAQLLWWVLVHGTLSTAHTVHDNPSLFMNERITHVHRHIATKSERVFSSNALFARKLIIDNQPFIHFAHHLGIKSEWPVQVHGMQVLSSKSQFRTVSEWILMYAHLV